MTTSLSKPNQLAMTTIGGTPLKCGEVYGEEFAQKILGFLNQEVFPTAGFHQV